MLVDTGSDVTLISSEFYKDIRLRASDLKRVSTKLTTADGDSLEVFGMTSVPLCFGGVSIDQNVIVANLGDLSGILGMDFLGKNRVSIDTAERFLMSPNFDIKLHNQVSTSRVCARVHLTETVHIPANSEIFVEGEIRGHFTGNQDGCLEPLETFKGGSHLLMPKSLVKMTESKVVFSILNPTHESRILKKNIQVASVQPAEQVLAVATSESKIEQNLSATGNKLPEHLRPLVEFRKAIYKRTRKFSKRH
ncbi:unnamed protein product [Mytilus coruscus]|uniref:Peptidase A2 domain-containing protein n=1 Tax=Mytilus coruscus TaxID=42192 RepID=A0A6J8EJK6_MYTCO|nr:unnamed protein product [Mytilus coruscus]